ncbi:hypothetical protein MKW98_026902 [Papaver atlanticum]|uniref:Uncharacterized protein n=1 Tax=Papaver atlanticum TaxID=357466 RepID=A0AAD4STQ6_9MAGN|nr:hypothetical protein MKW98_026902 [Papaver atlanticum]
MSRRSSEYAIGVAPKDKIFKKYIEIELNLATWIDVEPFMRGTCTGLQKTVMLRSNLLNWRYLWVRLSRPEQYLSLRQNNNIWICQNCCGRVKV